MFRPAVYIRFAFVFFAVAVYACKHREKQPVAAHPHAKPKSKTQVTTHKTDKESKNATGDLQQKLNVTNKQIRENKLYSFIDEWYSTPYKYGGCQRSGVDCSCFTSLLYEKVYGKKIARSAAEMFSACDKISIEDARQGDLVFFKIGGNSISHVGVFIKNKLFVHSSTSRGVIINSLEEAYYKKYFFCAGKMKNV